MKPCKYKKNPQVARRKLEEALLIVTTRDTTLHQLNSTAAFLYEAIGEQSLSKDEMICMLHEEYEVDRAQAEIDAELFLEEMMKKGILLEAE